MTLMKVIGTGDGTAFKSDLWLENCDLDHRGREPPEVTADGIVFYGVWGGKVTLTVHRDRARQFASGAEALSLWNTPSQTVPCRPDGRPNKPLAAYTIEVDNAP